MDPHAWYLINPQQIVNSDANPDKWAECNMETEKKTLEETIIQKVRIYNCN